MSDKLNISPIVIGISLVASPTKFKLVKGLIERLTLKEISDMYGIKYKYLVRLANDLVKKGLVSKSRLFRNSVYIPIPDLVKGFRISCIELYRRTSKLNDSERVKYLKMYGITFEELMKIVKKDVVESEPIE